MLNTKQSENKKSSKTTIFIKVFGFILLVGFVIISYLVFQDDNEDRRYVYPSSDLLNKFAYASLFEKEVLVQCDEINSFIGQRIASKSINKKIKVINIQKGEDSSLVNVYMYFEYGGMNLCSTFDTEITLNSDKKIEFNIIKAQIGKLLIPRGFATRIIKTIMENEVNIQGTSILIENKILLNEFNTEVELLIDKLEFKDDHFVLRLSGGADALKKLLGDNLSRFLSFVRK